MALGLADGDVLGLPVTGFADGEVLGLADGEADGEVLGLPVGFADGDVLGEGCPKKEKNREVEDRPGVMVRTGGDERTVGG